MIDLEIKQIYKDTISKLLGACEIEKSLNNFIDSYDGTNEDDFHTLMFKLLEHFGEYEDLKIVKEGFDKICVAQSKAKQQIKDVTRQFKKLEGGDALKTPSVVVGVSEEEATEE